MRGVNRVTILGNVGRDPEVRALPSGSMVANFSLATSESYNDKKTGERVDAVEWHKVVCFGRLAEIVQSYVKKGSRLYIEGSLRTRQWEKDGVTHYTTEINARELQMLDGKGERNDAPAESAAPRAEKPMSAKRQAQFPSASEDFDDGDLPF